MKYLRRIIWFIATRLVVICLILGLIITVFYYTMNVSNIQIVLKDGMAGRAKYVMGISENRNELDRYFQAACLENDLLVQKTDAGESPYANYTVRGIDHRLDVEFFWLWPWENSVRVNITEQIPRIDGRVRGSKAEEIIANADNKSKALYPPKWTEINMTDSASEVGKDQLEYRVILVRENGQWKIKTLTRINQ